MARTVAGTLLLPNGQPLANARIYFVAKRTEAASILEGVNASFSTNASGVYSQSIVNGYYSVSIEAPSDSSGTNPRRYGLGDAFVEAAATTTLEALLIASNPPDDTSTDIFYQILADCQQAAEDAQAAAVAAADSAASIDPDNFATAAQGAKADSAIQTADLNARLGTTGNLGTAAQQNSSAFATAVQGTKADSAIQTADLNTRLGTTGNLGTAAQQNSSAFATAAQGTKADSAIQTADLNTRLGTSGNLGTAAQKDVGTGTGNIPDNAQLNVRLGTTGNLGTMAQQSANAVAATGGTINGVSIGASTRASGAFTSLVTTGDAGFGVTSDGSARVQSSNGIKLGNSSNANASVLDWYEEGTFTPTIVGTSTSGSATYSIQIGRYQRIGNRVHFQISIQYSGHSGTGNMQINGLPFTANSLGNNYTTHSWYVEFPFTPGSRLTCFTGPNASYIGCAQLSSSGVVSGIPIVASTTLQIISGSYEV